MTLVELVSIYGKKKYITSVGDTIESIVQNIYNSRDDVYFQVIHGLNDRFDWDNMEPGSVVYYLPISACHEFSEYSSRW